MKTYILDFLTLLTLWAGVYAWVCLVYALQGVVS